jgi:hypothetical protein
MTHTENGFKLSERAERCGRRMVWFYDIFVTRDFLQKLFQQLIPKRVHDRKAATIKIVKTFFKDNSENMARRPK